ncbi:nicotinate phosphoribosyltransferase [Thermoactinospora rubra]|uniref:nicotinate phosphoribosyltransferase n=1 Tax=Thermoactinospora rubra TaxID=1088767 RepID=UPI000A11BF2F|nr:nicotinate phosphoribosyltransferase [Thermoactinospora rubra]
MPGALMTDLYELTMAAGYLRHGMTGQATFSLFARRLPPTRGFLVAAGLSDCLDFLEGLSFTDEELSYLAEVHGLHGLDGMRFTGEVWAVPEGRVVYANEPLLEVTAPIAEAQVVETMLLNHVTFQTSVAGKAARCVLAADGADLVDFAFRRTQGVDAAMAVARATAIAGFAATSNVEAARRYRLRATGTMAHSYIEAFADEATAFETFATDYPDRTVFLVDTYDTLEGVRAAIDVTRRLHLPGQVGVRLDSGDLATLSKQARALLDAHGLTSARVVASGGLDEHRIADLVRQGAPIDAYGVGTKVGVSADAPSLDSAYKLVEYDGRPVMKLSPGKATAPGRKQVFRGPSGDVLGLRTEPAPADHEALLIPVMRGGRRLTPPEPLPAARDRCAADLAALPEAVRCLDAPAAPAVRLSKPLADLAGQVRDALERRLGDATPPADPPDDGMPSTGEPRERYSAQQ